MIEISKDLAIDEKANAETLYKALKGMGYNPTYNRSSEFTYAFIVFNCGGSINIKFNECDDEKRAKVRSITKRIDDPVFPSTFETLYKRNWWN